MNQRQNPQQPPQVIIVQQKQGHGCLITAVMFLLFGWIGVAALAAWKLTVWSVRVTWNATVTLTRWSWAATVALTKWSWLAGVALSREAARGARAFHARYGARGWAIVGGVVAAAAVALVVISVIVSAVGGSGH